MHSLHGERGFTLVEVLVAFAIVAAMMAAAFQIFSGGFQSYRAANQAAAALRIAQSNLNSVGSAIPLHPGRVSGTDSAGRFKWTVIIDPQESVMGERMISTRVFHVSSSAAWAETGRERSVTLKTIKIEPRR